METRYIEITLETAKRWYEQGGELKDIALGVYSYEELDVRLPRTFDEYMKRMAKWLEPVCDHEYKDNNPQIAAVKKLILLRDFYNNGWKPICGDYLEKKFAIEKDYKIDPGEFEYSVRCVYKPSSFLVFNKFKYAEEFLSNFRELIEEAGDLI